MAADWPPSQTWLGRRSAFYAQRQLSQCWAHMHHLSLPDSCFLRGNLTHAQLAFKAEVPSKQSLISGFLLLHAKQPRIRKK